MQTKGKTAAKVIGIILVLLLVAGLVAIIYKFTNGFNEDFKTFYVEYGGKQILAADSQLSLTTGKTHRFDVKYTFDTPQSDIKEYSVEIVPNAQRDFDFTVDGERYLYSKEDDLTAAFGLNKQDTYFELVIPEDFSLETALQNCYPGKDIVVPEEAADANAYPYMLVISSYNDSVVYHIATYLRKELIDEVTALQISTEEAVITENIFNRLEGIPLIDKYVAYQLLSDIWQTIETDVEIIQTEGFDATKKVDPKMVLKKEKGKEVEVQDGWIGHVVPFEVVQSSLLKEQAEQVREKENRVTELDSEFNELVESFTEEDKESFPDLFDDEGNVVNASIAKTVKALKKYGQKYDEDSAEWKVIRLGTVTEELKSAKRTAKDLSDKMVEQTKAAIENLTDEQVKEMLYLKWIKPLCDGIFVLPESIVSSLTNEINALTKKYSVTLLDVEAQIDETEQAFADMIDDLEGSEFDMLGLKELQKMLRGEKNG